jgi:hypothetical protein
MAQRKRMAKPTSRAKKPAGRGGLRVWGEDHGAAKLTESIVVRCRQRARGGASVKELAERYGVSHGAMSMAISGATWRHLPGAIKARRT